MGKCKPIKEWLGEPGEFCKPCTFPPLIAWYKDELSEKGFGELVRQIDEAVETDDVEKIGETLDFIKEKVPPDVRERLEEFDCTVQAFAEEQEKP